MIKRLRYTVWRAGVETSVYSFESFFLSKSRTVLSFPPLIICMHSLMMTLFQFKEFLKNELEGYHEEVKKAEEWRKRLEGLEFSNSTTLLDDNEEKELEGSWFNIFGSAGAKPRRYWTSQRYATYPPTIPGLWTAWFNYEHGTEWLLYICRAN